MFGYTPAISVGGIIGWRLLQRSQEAQTEALTSTARLQRELKHFDENITSALTIDALMDDPILLRVTLGAFGLESEAPKKAYIRKVLEEGTVDDDAFANRIQDKRFRDFSEALGYGNIGGTKVLLSTFKTEIKAAFITHQFEQAVGTVDSDLRLALNFTREIGRIAARDNVERVGWFEIMGQAPLRRLVSTALNLPLSTATLDLDRQRELFEDRAERVFGGKFADVFSDPENVDKAVNRFLLLSQLNGTSGSRQIVGGSTALTLLQASPLGGNSAAGLLFSLL